MPIFEYRCGQCGRVSEFLEGVGQDAPEKKCPYCDSHQLERMLSTSHISSGGHFIGSQGGATCCGRTERCEKPPCGDGGVCRSGR